MLLIWTWHLHNSYVILILFVKPWKLGDRNNLVLAANLLILLLLCSPNEQFFQFLFYWKECHMLSQCKAANP